MNNNKIEKFGRVLLTTIVVGVGLSQMDKEVSAQEPDPALGFIAPYLGTIVCEIPTGIVEYPLDLTYSTIPDLVTYPGIEDAPASTLPKVVDYPIPDACTQ